MGKFFSHKNYDDILKELEGEEGWLEFDEEEQSEEITYEDDAYELEDLDFDGGETKVITLKNRGTEPEISEDDEDEEDEDDDKIGGIISFKALQIAFAVIILCLAGVFGVSVYKGMQTDAKQVAANYESIGTNLMDVQVIGGDGLLALQQAMSESYEGAEGTESSEYQETNTKANVQVELVLTSVQKDLKVKFTNKKTGKLIGNIPFQVQIKDPNGKTSTWTDEDKDGIIYKKNITSGKYTVTLIPLEDEKYEKYLMLASDEKVTVKEKIEYEKVDVSAEVKDEKEIDVKKEEQQVVQTPVEEELKDTVAWVESSKTHIGNTYKEISKSDIAAPSAGISSLSFIRTEKVEPITDTEVETTTESTDTSEPTEEPTATPEPTEEPTATPEPTAAPTAAPTEAPTEAPATPAPTATPTVTASPSPSPSPSATPTATPTAAPTATPTPTASPSPTPTPTATPAPVALKTKSGQAVYIKDGSSYKAATSADYNTSGMKFYILQEGYKYTGWNTINGELYYYDANGNVVTGEQVIRGVIYHFDSTGKLAGGDGVLGIDVSSHNGSVDWKAVANSGVDYVIIRCGYRGYGSGVLVEDSRYRTNINGAINAGLKVGVYFFSQALDEIEAVEEASMVLEAVQGYKITFPIFLDVEYSNSAHNGRADGLNADQRTAICNAFSQTIRNAGYRAGVYANKSWLENHIKPSQFSSSTKIWLAQYAKKPSYTGRYEMWQYSSTGTISGLKGNVDLNMSYLGY